jgi:two-component system sensor histidine kinase TctE
MESVRSALKQLETSSRRAVRLANQLLTLARAEPGKENPMDFKPVDLAALTHQVCMEWVPQALAHEIDLGFSGSEAEVTIQGDALLLSEMLNNLIDNATRYGSRGCIVTVRLENLPSVTLSVEDNGPGIAASERERVFERFYRIPGSPAGGCGLGLSIVAEIAHQHGASVSIREPEQGTGTIVTVSFANP